ncbi:coiled-coil-helix-coiled-coil-helix domain-containing protein 7 isoform X2 [Hetaerina americana]|uniref:coiled-coil-helix-coiled-coil-helix domain-containing protein 7 isoform X2 n=1 Tax=Hetaerina americana TaxID=62018 RepID=UPI003A7F50C2
MNVRRSQHTKEQAMSYKCLDDNNFDKDKCQMFFENYRKCQDFWTKISNERRRKGIEPYMPFPEERDRIKEEYIKSRKN